MVGLSPASGRGPHLGPRRPASSPSTSTVGLSPASGRCPHLGPRRPASSPSISTVRLLLGRPPGPRRPASSPSMSVRRPTVAAVFMAGDSIIYSALDLAAAARCEYALLRDFDARLGWAPGIVVEDELLARTAALGDQHERRRLEQ